jgi:hypothetical protein
MRICRESRSSRRKPAPVPLCSPHILFDLTWDRTQAAKVGSRRLTAWAMARSVAQVTQRRIVDWFVNNHTKKHQESNSVLIQVQYQNFPGGWRKSRANSVKKAEIWIEHLPNTSLQFYRYAIRKQTMYVYFVWFRGRFTSYSQVQYNPYVKLHCRYSITEIKINM